MPTHEASVEEAFWDVFSPEASMFPKSWEHLYGHHTPLHNATSGEEICVPCSPQEVRILMSAITIPQNYF